MISADIRLEGFDARSWMNFISIFSPDQNGNATTHDTNTPRGTLFIFHDEQNHVLKSFSSTHGRIAKIAYHGPQDLESLCQEHHTARAYAFREGALEELAETMAEFINEGDDYVAQWLTLLRFYRSFRDTGAIHIWPPPVRFPIPSAAMVRRALDIVLPVNECFVLALWEGTNFWTAAAMRRHATGIDWIVGPEHLQRWCGPLGGDWRRDHRLLARAVRDRLGPVHMGIFSERATIRRLIQYPDAGAWTRAVAVRDVIVHPVPPYVAVALAADTLRAFTHVSSEFLGQLDFLAPLTPMGRYVRNRFSDIASMTSTLGFNPLDALAESIRRRSTPAKTSSE